MSSQYTTARSFGRAKRWGTYVLDIAFPLLLAAITLNAWADSHPRWVYYLVATDFYVITRIASRISRIYNLAIFLVLAGGQFFALGIYSNIFTSSTDGALIATASVLMSVICVLFARTEVHGIRLRRLTAPTGGARAADFPGIYRITCLPNKKQYIGQTSQAITARWAEHRAHLNGRRHHNRWLQADWDLYRPEQFKWEVLEVVTDPVWLLDRERHWQDVDYDAAMRYNPPNLAPRIVKASNRPPMKRRRRA